MPDALETFDAAWTTRYRLSAPRALELEEIALANASLRILYDTRVFELVAPAQGGPISIEDQRDGVGFEASVLIRILRRSAKRGDPSGVMIPLVPRNLYPHENIGEPFATQIELLDDDSGRVVSRWVSPVTSEPSPEVWGAEIAATWVRPDNESGAELKAGLPDRVLVRSVGPSAIPSGAVIAITLDERVATDLRLNDSPLEVPAQLSSLPRRTNSTGVRQWDLSLMAPVPADTELNIGFSGELESPLTVTRLRQPGRMSFIAPSSGLQRQSRTLSIVDQKAAASRVKSEVG